MDRGEQYGQMKKQERGRRKQCGQMKEQERGRRGTMWTDEGAGAWTEGSSAGRRGRVRCVGGGAPCSEAISTKPMPRFFIGRAAFQVVRGKEAPLPMWPDHDELIFMRIRYALFPSSGLVLLYVSMFFH